MAKYFVLGSIKSVAEMFEVSQTTALKLVEQIPNCKIKIGASVRYRLDVIREFLESREEIKL